MHEEWNELLINFTQIISDSKVTKQWTENLTVAIFKGKEDPLPGNKTKRVEAVRVQYGSIRKVFGFPFLLNKYCFGEYKTNLKYKLIYLKS